MIERIIHPRGKEKAISKKEYDQSMEPYQQHVELYNCLRAWCEHAESIIEKDKQRKEGEQIEEEDEKIKKGAPRYGPEKCLCWYPQKIETTNDEVRDADAVLRAIRQLYEALFTDDKKRIANAGISVGLAVSRAHALPYEALAIIGKKSKEGPQKRTDQEKVKEPFIKWLRENEDKVRHCQNVNDIRNIYPNHLPVNDVTVKKWFKEVCPGPLKRGRSKK